MLRELSTPLNPNHEGWTPKSATVRLQAILHGRWGVAQGYNCRTVLEVIATLIEAQRPDLAVVLIEKELNSQT